MLRPLHVDEVDDDDPAEVAQPQLTGDLLGRLEVGLQRPSLRAVAPPTNFPVLTSMLTERLGLLDDDRAARTSATRAGRSAFRCPGRRPSRRRAAPAPVQPQARRELRIELAAGKSRPARCMLVVVDDDAARGVGRRVAQRAEEQVEIRVQERRRRSALVLLLDRPPQSQESSVGLEGDASALAPAVRTMKPAGRLAEPGHDVAQALPSSGSLIAARHATKRRLRRVDEIAPGKRDEARDARPFAAERLARTTCTTSSRPLA